MKQKELDALFQREVFFNEMHLVHNVSADSCTGTFPTETLTLFYGMKWRKSKEKLHFVRLFAHKMTLNDKRNMMFNGETCFAQKWTSRSCLCFHMKTWNEMHLVLRVSADSCTGKDETKATSPTAISNVDDQSIKYIDLHNTISKWEKYQQFYFERLNTALSNISDECLSKYEIQQRKAADIQILGA